MLRESRADADDLVRVEIRVLTGYSAVSALESNAQIPPCLSLGVGKEVVIRSIALIAGTRGRHRLVRVKHRPASPEWMGVYGLASGRRSGFVDNPGVTANANAEPVRVEVEVSDSGTITNLESALHGAEDVVTFPRPAFG